MILSNEARMSMIPGIFLKAPTNGHSNYLIAEGSTHALNMLRKFLTFKNKSNEFRIMQIKKTLREAPAWITSDKKEVLKKELEELSDQVHVEYYEESDGKLIIPAGYWYLGEKVENDIHLNNEIKPVIVPGSRPYQAEAVTELMRYKRGTLVLATGLGKTYCCVSICMSAILAGKRICIIVPTEYLIQQVVKTLKNFTDSVTGASSERIPKLGTDILVCTVGTAGKYIDRFDVVIQDESHHSAASTWSEVLSMAKAEYVYNLTATPFRTDGMDTAIHAFGGPIVYERDVSWGINNGWLSPFDAFTVYIDHGASIKSTSSRASAYKKSMNYAYIGEVAKHLRAAIAGDRKIICLFKTIVAAKQLASMFGLSVADAKYKKPLYDFQNGVTKVLIASDRLVSEGVDIPDADVLILCTQNSSDIITMQALGRVLRKSEGKKTPLVIDCIAKGYDSFENSGRKRMKIWKKLSKQHKEIGRA